MAYSKKLKPARSNWFCRSANRQPAARRPPKRGYPSLSSFQSLSRKFYAALSGVKRFYAVF
jgi:hypothetical protein